MIKNRLIFFGGGVVSLFIIASVIFWLSDAETVCVPVGNSCDCTGLILGAGLCWGGDTPGCNTVFGVAQSQCAANGGTLVNPGGGAQGTSNAWFCVKN